jgi:hypothetical protein
LVELSESGLLASGFELLLESGGVLLELEPELAPPGDVAPPLLLLPLGVEFSFPLGALVLPGLVLISEFVLMPVL